MIVQNQGRRSEHVEDTQDQIMIAIADFNPTCDSVRMNILHMSIAVGLDSELGQRSEKCKCIAPWRCEYKTPVRPHEERI